MVGLYSPNYESDIDEVIRELAEIDITSALFWWLHSRAYSQKNEIRICRSTLAEILGVTPRSISRSAEKLAEAGLIHMQTKRGEGGGVVFNLTCFPSLLEKIDNSNPPCNATSIKAKKSLRGYAVSNQTSLSAKQDKGVSKNMTSSSSEYDSLDTSNMTRMSYNKDIDINKELRERDGLPPSLAPDVIAYLNEQACTSYSTSNPSYSKLITDLVAEGYKFEDFKRVIDNKCSEWLGTKMQGNLRPNTIFSQAHFDEYLNQPVVPNSKKGDGLDDDSEYNAPLESILVH